MLKIRLRRVGGKRQPSYRIVVAESTAPRDGKFVENIGFYNPRTEPETVKVKEDRVLYWLSVGAQPTDSLNHLLNKIGTLDRFARFKAGEPLETLVEEAIAAEQPVDPQTKPALRVVKAEPVVEAVEEEPAEVETEG